MDRRCTMPAQQREVRIEMKFEELKALADEQISYPFEAVVEKYWPLADTLSDYICMGIITMEDAFDGDGLGEEKKEALLDGLNRLWDAAPIPFVIKKFLGAILPGIFAWLIDQIVEMMNKLLSRVNDGVIDLGEVGE